MASNIEKTLLYIYLVMGWEGGKEEWISKVD